MHLRLRSRWGAATAAALTVIAASVAPLYFFAIGQC